METNAFGRRAVRLAAAALVVILLGVAIVASIHYQRAGRAVEPDTRDGRTNVDFAAHPTLSAHDYAQSDGVLDLGVQPCWIPTNLIVEAMERDALLEAALAEHGTTIRYHGFMKGDDANYYLEQGDLEGVIGGDMPALMAAARVGTAIVSLMQLGFCSIVAEKLMLMEDLRGKCVGVPFGSVAHHAFLNAISSSGLSADDVEIVFMDVDGMPAALQQGVVDAFVAWEPAPTIALEQPSPPAIIHRSMTSGYLYFAGSYAERHPEVVREIVAAQTRAIYWMKRDPANLLAASEWALRTAADWAGTASPIGASDYASLAEADILSTSPMPALPVAQITEGGYVHREYLFLVEMGLMPEAVAWSTVAECFDTSVLAEVVSQRQAFQVGTFSYRTDSRIR